MYIHLQDFPGVDREGPMDGPPTESLKIQSPFPGKRVVC